jgi:hypothetical protein
MTAGRTLFLLSALLYLNGCTVLGMAADNAVENHEERHRPIMEQGQEREVGTDATEAGLEADMGMLKKLKAAVTPEDKKQRLVCSYENNLRVCYYEDATQ